jgi:hypothetical protein
LQEYHLNIKHIPGKQHAAADLLSRPPGVDQGENDNSDITLLPNQLFIKLANEPDLQWTSIETQVAEAQQQHEAFMKDWQQQYQLKLTKSAMEPQLQLWTKEGKMVIPPDNQLK